MPRSLHPLRVALLALALAAIALTAAPAGAAERAPVPQLDWKDCDDGSQCATAEVPLDHSRPHGRMIDLALVRFPAVDREHRIGSLFIHPGGSGGAGVQFVRGAPPQVLALIGRRFDVIGVDTRGVGASRPAFDCDADPEQLGVYSQPFPRPDTLDVPALAARTKAYVRRCAQRNGALLAHMSSADMARDFDLLRAAVGDRKISFIGKSYGSLVGATYASLFPGRARALLLADPMDADATPALVVGITHDPWTPFAWARRTVADVVDLGSDIDRFIWNPGDGNDVVDGRGGHDILFFFGTNDAEVLDLSAQGHRLRLSRDVASVVMDVDDMEEINPVVNGGADTIGLDDLGATGVDEVNVNLEPGLGTPGGDGVPDRVIATGTDGDDEVTVAGANGTVAVTGLAATLGITHAESIDSLAIDTRDGHDAVDAAGLAPDTIQLTTD
jgi:pimeloyl-ACP methyl ester carboxylesterase